MPTIAAAVVAVALGAALVAALAAPTGASSVVVVAADSLVRIDAGSSRVVAALPVATSPMRVASDGRTVWAYSDAADARRLTRVDPVAGEVTGTFEASMAVATNLAVAGDSVWLGGGDDRFAARPIDASRFVRLRPGGVAAEPVQLAVETLEYLWPVAAAGSLWVSCCRMPPELVRVDPVSEAVVARIRGATQVIAEGPGYVWALNVDATPAPGRAPALQPTTKGSSVGLLRIDTTTNESTPLAETLAVTPADFAFADGAVWVTAPLVDALVRLDAATGEERGRVAIGRRPGAVAYADGALWVSLHADGAVARYDLQTGELRTIGVGGTPTDLVAAGDSVWVAVDVA